MPFSQSLLPEFDEEMKNTRRLLECIPDGKLDYQPHPRSMSLARLASQKIWTFKVGGTTVISMPRSAVMRSVIMNHLIHHRAQLGVFLRLNEVKIPGMYGPSADEKSFMDAHAA